MHTEIIMRATRQRRLEAQYSVFVGHGSRWHNPFEFEGGEEAYYAFREWFHSAAYAAVRLRKGVLDKLGDKALVCDCGDLKYCHATILAEFVEDQS